MFTIPEIGADLITVMWLTLRVGGMVMTAPLLNQSLIPVQVRVLVTVVIAVAVLPLAGTLPDYSPLSLEGGFAVARELALGAACGFTLKLATEAAVLAGQLVSTGMGLSFATVVDPQQGGIPLIGRLYTIIATLLLLATNAHLALIALVAKTYAIVPVGTGGLTAPAARDIVEFAGLMFAGAVQLALPSVIAILMVNIAFGVISRAAPTLNLFAVGFPITIMMGLLVLVATVRTQGPVWESLFDSALGLLTRSFGGG